MNKKKWIIESCILVILIIATVIIVSVISRKRTDAENPNVRYFDGGKNVDNIEWISVAEDGVSTCIVQYEAEPYYSIVPGKYIIGSSVKGKEELIASCLEYNYEYDVHEVYVYDIYTGEKKFLFNEAALMEECPGMQVPLDDPGCYIIDEQFVYLDVWERRPSEGMSYDDVSDKDYIYVNIEDGSYSIQEEAIESWNTYSIRIFTRLEEKILLKNNLPEGMIEKINPYFYARPYQNFEGVFEVRGLAEYLPEHNEVLYGMFPGLEQYRGEEDCYICLYIAGNPTAEELLRLFMEDGQEISFEGAVLSGEYTVDGEDHEIHSFEEYEQWDILYAEYEDQQ